MLDSLGEAAQIRNMKYFINCLLLVASLTLVTVGCRSMLTTMATPASVPVQLGVATTNDPVAVAYLKAAQLANQNLNPTPTEQPINMLLTAAISFLSLASGWLIHKSGVAVGNANAATTDTTVNVPPKGS